jgi:hypothetical protein
MPSEEPVMKIRAIALLYSNALEINDLLFVDTQARLPTLFQSCDIGADRDAMTRILTRGLKYGMR